jgi:asparagine synthetase B (glutamine-hydrolysing)
MSGIAGIWGFGDEKILLPLSAMERSLKRRRPGIDASRWVSDNLAISYLPYQSGSKGRQHQQPFSTSDVIAVIDGRIDNRDDLRRALRPALDNLDLPDVELLANVY